MKPWAWLLIFFLTVGASVYLWKKSPAPERGPIPSVEAGANTPQGAPPTRPVEMIPANKEPGTNRLPSPRVVQPDSPLNANPGNEVPAQAPKDSPSEFNPPPIPQPGFYPPSGAPDGETGYPGYVPPPGSLPPEEGETGFVPQPFEPPPPLDEEFIPPPPLPENDSEL